MQYLENWNVQIDDRGSEEISRLYSTAPLQIVTLETDEKTSNSMPDVGFDLPDSIEELESIPKAFFNIPVIVSIFALFELPIKY
ncbi:MAG: hypothetical protein M3Q77_07535 [Thermoproteota archaeon]|nr:hypothetical protein [Thermoproteota archaeon]